MRHPAGGKASWHGTARLGEGGALRAVRAVRASCVVPRLVRAVAVVGRLAAVTSRSRLAQSPLWDWSKTRYTHTCIHTVHATPTRSAASSPCHQALQKAPGRPQQKAPRAPKSPQKPPKALPKTPAPGCFTAAAPAESRAPERGTAQCRRRQEQGRGHLQQMRLGPEPARRDRKVWGPIRIRRLPGHGGIHVHDLPPYGVPGVRRPALRVRPVETRSPPGWEDRQRSTHSSSRELIEPRGRHG